MAYYTYYQSSQPTWGTQQYQFIPPPIPQYQPQPSWNGSDYYRAHADSADSTLFDYVWSKAKHMLTGTSVGSKEAHHWWKRVYGGLVNPSKLLPREIGAAAGYEAIRCWEHHKPIYVQPLSDDREREREALIGLAAGEAEKLWAYTQRPRDKYGRLEASEVAAATASHIFNRSYDYNDPYEQYERHPHTRRRSVSVTRHRNASGGSFYDDNNAELDSRIDYLDAYPRRSRSRSRSQTRYGRGRSSSHYHSPSPVSFSRRSVSPVVYGVGTTSAAVNYQASYDPVLGPGIPGTYYPSATPYYGSSSTAHTYQQAPSTAGYVIPGGSPYTYAGSSVGLPQPPTGQYLGAPDTYRHHRTRSTGAYGATRPSFGY